MSGFALRRARPDLPTDVRLCAAGVGPLVVLAALVGVGGALVPAGRLRADDRAPHPGELIYRTQCASCHGANGEGNPDEYPEPLAGDRSIGELSDVITQTMPADDPDACVGTDADAVAAWMHEAFYSPAAQARNQPPRIELVRLTGRQYRQSVSDLIGSFRWTPNVPAVRGLKTTYFRDRRPRRDDLEVERLEGAINLSLETIDPKLRERLEAPSSDQRKGGIVPKDKTFCVRYEGSLLPERTGLYEIHLVTGFGAEVRLNGGNAPFIDARVRSGPESEYTQMIALEAGRPVPLTVETFRENETEGRVRLEWTPPGGVRELIPTRCLEPESSPALFVLTSTLPPDDASAGYERGTMISEAWDQATTDAAFEVVDYVLANLDELAKTKAGNGDRPKKLQEFCQTFVRRAFRRPLTGPQKTYFVDRFFEGMPGEGEERDSFLIGAVSRVVLLTLKSPRFLYPGLHEGEQDGYDAMARMALALWDSIPDENMLTAVEKGWIKDERGFRQQAEKMVNDHRCRAKVERVLHHWLRVEHLTDLAKDEAAYPGFDPQIMADLRTSLDLLLADVVWSDASDFRVLMQGTDVPLSERLRDYYGVPKEIFEKARDAQHAAQKKAVEEYWSKQTRKSDKARPDAVTWADEFVRVPFEPELRGGVISHPFLMAGFAYTSTSSPIHRGVFLARNVFGRTLRPPNEAFTPFSPKDHPNLTTRERVGLQTDSAACQACHSLINPLGFTLEAFDAVGRFRKVEGERPVDTTGRYRTVEDEVVEFDGPRSLSTFLAGSEETQRAFAVTMLHGLVGQPAFAFGAETPERLQKSFADKGFNIKSLVAEVATLAATQGERTAE